MGRRQGSHHTGSRIAAALLVLCLAGCDGGYIVRGSSMSGPPPPPPSATLTVTSSPSGSVFAALFGLGMLGVAAGVLPVHEPVMHPDRRVAEQDCSRPIEDFSANLRCR
jgi:hypothetical protein